MRASESARSRITESTNSVANAAQWLQRVADDPQSRTFAIERLEVAAARQLGELAAVESQYFDAGRARAVARQGPGGPAELLAGGRVVRAGKGVAVATR
jgi:hypothetical protein